MVNTGPRRYGNGQPQGGILTQDNFNFVNVQPIQYTNEYQSAFILSLGLKISVVNILQLNEALIKDIILFC